MGELSNLERAEEILDAQYKSARRISSGTMDSENFKNCSWMLEIAKGYIALEQARALTNVMDYSILDPDVFNMALARIE